MPLSKYKTFLEKLFKKIKALDINTAPFEIDHIAYQTSSSACYEATKKEFANVGKMAKETLVGNRRISIFKLNNPLHWEKFTISVAELIEPKEGQSTKDGLEHIELIGKATFKQLIKKYPKLDWDKSAVDRELYPMLKLRLDEHTQVKFPKYSILHD